MRTGFWSYPSILIQIFLAVLTSAFGFCLFGLYIYKFEINIAIWAFFTSLFGLSVVHLHILFLKNDLDAWYDPESFSSIKKLSVVFLLVGLVGLITNTILGYSKKEVFQLSGFYFAAVICSVLVFWSFIIIISTRKYKRYVELCIPIFDQK